MCGQSYCGKVIVGMFENSLLAFTKAVLAQSKKLIKFFFAFSFPSVGFIFQSMDVLYESDMIDHYINIELLN